MITDVDFKLIMDDFSEEFGDYNIREARAELFRIQERHGGRGIRQIGVDGECSPSERKFLRNHILAMTEKRW